MRHIPYGRQYVSEEDIRAVTEVLRSDFLTTGPVARKFEDGLCEVTGAEYAVVVSSGTAALHLASLTLLNPGDKVLTTVNSFAATANSILYAGGVPVFCDIAPDGNIDLDKCEEMLRADEDIKALYAVHFSGNPVNQTKLKNIREKYGIKILEDCAHSIYAETEGIRAGSCTNSDCSILSFHPVKNLTSGEGGAVTTNNKEIYDKIMRLRTHGIIRSDFADKDEAYDSKGVLKPWYSEMHELGFNYRISDIHCALGLSQLGKIDTFTNRRRELARKYSDAFADYDKAAPLYPYTDNSAYHLFVLKINFDQIKYSRAELINTMIEKKVGMQVHYMPTNKFAYYKSLGYGNEHTPVMDDYYKKCLSIPLFPDMTDAEADYVISNLKVLMDE